jgi:hypothetical protein
VQIPIQKLKKYEKLKHMPPPEVNNSTIVDTNDSEVDETLKIQKNINKIKEDTNT